VQPTSANLGAYSNEVEPPAEKITFKSKQYDIVSMETAISMKPEIAIFSAGGSTSLEYAPKFAEVEPPAEKIAISGYIEIAVSIETMSYCLLLKVIFFPTDFSDATGINSVIGRFLSSKTFNITWPTIPVAPTLRFS
jgi:hypothetical protein